MALMASAKNWARSIKRDVLVVYFAARNPETPLIVRILALAIAAYALSPIDLIPDFIPILGYLDDLIIVPDCVCLAGLHSRICILATTKMKASVGCVLRTMVRMAHPTKMICLLR